MIDFDLIVVGGGMVGSSLATRLANDGHRVALIEQQLPTGFDPSARCALRVSALNRSSQHLLEQIGAWPNLLKMRAHCYRRLSVWQQGGARTDFSAAEVNADHLGYLVENAVVQQAIWESMNNSSVALFAPDQVASMAQTASSVTLTLQSGQQLRADFVVAADGAGSQIRQLAGIGVSGWEYQQHALVVAVELTTEAPDITWQSFVESGPRAFLPLPEQQASLVWYHSPEQVAEFMKLNDSQLESVLRESFPEQLPDFKIIDRGYFPLKRQHANQYVAGRVVLVGDAAHVINPLAGQGVNLGFQDVNCLADELQAVSSKEWELAVKRYQQKRRAANLLMMTAMDSLYAGFSSEKGPLRLLRNSALWLANQASPLKVTALRYAMGLPLH
jgi:2-octaprenyl-3-methyl-6-methoxy-1,4-benzoquinol hydroxylase